MTKLENRARKNHKSGCNCSQSVAVAYADKMVMTSEEARTLSPAPRSIAGKCGALLAAEMVLERLSIDKKDELEKRFSDENGAVECSKLRSPEIRKFRSCNDFVGSAARLLEEMIS